MAGADDEHTSTSEDERELRESERVRSHIYIVVGMAQLTILKST